MDISIWHCAIFLATVTQLQFMLKKVSQMSASTQISPRDFLPPGLLYQVDVKLNVQTGCSHFYAHDHRPGQLSKQVQTCVAEIYRIYKKLYFQVVADLMCRTCSVPGWQRCVLCPRPDLLIPSETAAVWLSDKLAQFNLAQLGSRRCASRPHGLL